MPIVRFAYFPRWRYLWFWNFTNRAERIRKGLKAFEYARRRGWPGVEARLRDYGVLPEAFFRDPAGYYADLTGEPAR